MDCDTEVKGTNDCLLALKVVCVCVGIFVLNKTRAPKEHTSPFVQGPKFYTKLAS